MIAQKIDSFYLSFQDFFSLKLFKNLASWLIQFTYKIQTPALEIHFYLYECAPDIYIFSELVGFKLDRKSKITRSNRSQSKKKATASKSKSATIQTPTST